MPKTVITVEGPPRVAGALASGLEKEGFKVDYEPPYERRGLAEDAVVIAIAHSDAT